MIQINDITKVNDKNKRHNHISIKQLRAQNKTKTSLVTDSAQN